MKMSGVFCSKLYISNIYLYSTILSHVTKVSVSQKYISAWCTTYCLCMMSIKFNFCNVYILAMPHKEMFKGRKMRLYILYDYDHYKVNENSRRCWQGCFEKSDMVDILEVWVKHSTSTSTKTWSYQGSNQLIVSTLSNILLKMFTN